MRYAKRICMVCGSEFEPVYPAQIACGENCRKERLRILKYACKIRRKSCVYNDLDWANARLEEAYARLGKLERARVPEKAALVVDACPVRDKDSPARTAPDAPKKPVERKGKPQKPQAFTLYCMRCGKSFTANTRNRIYCDDCSVAPMSPMTRKCHDCGAPTSDYRCPECWAKWRGKNGVRPAEMDECPI